MSPYILGEVITVSVFNNIDGIQGQRTITYFAPVDFRTVRRELDPLRRGRNEFYLSRRYCFMDINLIR